LNGETAFLSLGSNLGKREQNLGKAVEALGRVLKELRCSSIYETKPMYFLEQPNFLNMVVMGQCLLPPKELLQRTLSIEIQMGRERANYIPKGPRLIDIDILLFGRRIIRENELSIPHPHLKERQFVLIPLLELKPNLKDPEVGRPLSESLHTLGDQGVYIFSS
jgi:2-amino-4-hydroxy-6-hydroxymethyldihydropteridine diphosphokinase